MSKDPRDMTAEEKKAAIEERLTLAMLSGDLDYLEQAVRLFQKAVDRMPRTASRDDSLRLICRITDRILQLKRETP